MSIIQKKWQKIATNPWSCRDKYCQKIALNNTNIIMCAEHRKTFIAAYYILLYNYSSFFICMKSIKNISILCTLFFDATKIYYFLLQIQDLCYLEASLSFPSYILFSSTTYILQYEKFSDFGQQMFGLSSYITLVWKKNTIRIIFHWRVGTLIASFSPGLSLVVESLVSWLHPLLLIFRVTVVSDSLTKTVVL